MLLLSSCTTRIADFTLASSKNINLNSDNLVIGDRVTGEDKKIIVYIPLGIPSVKEAADQAIEKNKCAVGLSDVTLTNKYLWLFFGYTIYEVEGNLVIDKSLPGCDE